MRLWAVDAGGSSTTALVDGGERWRRGSVNPASVGAETADAELLDLFHSVGERIGARPAFGWFATATVDAGTPEPELARLTGLAEQAGLTGRLIISRDIVPLLVAPPLQGRGVAVVCGTGSGFLAGDGVAEPLPVGGCEYLGSDEGSAFAIGLAGLRAAVRGTDGRGRPTALGGALAGPGGTVTELARRLATRPFPKAQVAALAPAVCRCWVAGDAVAGEVIGTALDELITGVRAARDRVGLTGGWSVVLSGGVLRGCPEFTEALSGRIEAELGARPGPTLVQDPAAVVLAAATTCQDDDLPANLAGCWAWSRELGVRTR